MITPMQTTVEVFHSFKNGMAIKAIFGYIASYTAYLLGYDFIIVDAIAILVIIDLATGSLKALYLKNFTSHKLMKTAYKVILYYFLLIMAHQALKFALIPDWFDDVIEAFIAVTEIVSILENVADMGFPKIRKIVALINKNYEEKLARFFTQ